jgi:hypothetical protein
MNRFVSRVQKVHTIDVIKHILRYVKRYVDCRILYKKGDKNLIEVLLSLIGLLTKIVDE